MTIAMCGRCEMLWGRPQPDCDECGLKEGTGRDKDDPRYPYDYTEWWMCDNCKMQFYVPEDFGERPDYCPACGHTEHTLKDCKEATNNDD